MTTIYPWFVGAGELPALPMVPTPAYKDANSDPDEDVYLQHLFTIATQGVPAIPNFVINYIGTGTKADPDRAAGAIMHPFEDPTQLLGGLPIPNYHTEPEAGGDFPSVKESWQKRFSLLVHGYPGWNGYGDITQRLRPTYSQLSGAPQGTLLFAGSEECLGTIQIAVPDGTGGIDVFLEYDHGKTPGSTFTVWIAGVEGTQVTSPTNTQFVPEWSHQPPSAGAPQAKYTATAHATDPKQFKITPPNSSQAAIDQGVIGPTGCVVAPYHLIQSITDMGGGVLRFVVDQDIPAGHVFTEWAASIWIGDVTGTATNLSRRWVNGRNTITRVNDTTIDVDVGGTPNIAGWNNDGFIFFRGPWHPVFLDDFGETADDGTPLAQLRYHLSVGGNRIYSWFAAAGNPVGFGFSIGMFLWGIGWNDNAAPGDKGYASAANAWGLMEKEVLEHVWDYFVNGGIQSEDRQSFPLAVVQMGRKGEIDENNTAQNSDGSNAAFTTAVANQQAQHLPRVSDWIQFIDVGDIPRRVGDVFFTGEGQRMFADRAFRAWERLNRLILVSQGNPRVEGRGLPVYVYLGNGQAHAASNAAAVAGQDPDYDGTNYDLGQNTVVRERLCFMWNNVLQQPEEYSSVKHGNLYTPRWIAQHPTLAGDLASKVGPECRLILELGRAHPEGCYLIKLSVPNCRASLTNYGNTGVTSLHPNAGDVMRDLEDAWQNLKDWMHENGHVPDMRGLFLDLGEDDAADAEVQTASHQQDLIDIVTHVRDKLSTGSSSRDTYPVAIVQTQQHDRHGTGVGQSGIDSARIDQIRDAQAAAVSALELAVLVDTADLHISNDNLNRSWGAMGVLGLRMDAAFRTIAQDVDELRSDHIINDAPGYVDGGSGGNSAEALVAVAEAEAAAASTGSSLLAASLAAAGGAGGYSAADLLAQVNYAISAFLGDEGIQEWSGDGFSAKRADLPQLMQARTMLRAEADAACGGRINVFRRGSY